MGREEEKGALTDGREFGAVDADHAEIADFASPSEIEQRQANNTNFLVRARGTTADEAGGVLAGANLGFGQFMPASFGPENPKHPPSTH
jgi:hypothetical protein